MTTKTASAKSEADRFCLKQMTKQGKTPPNGCSLCSKIAIRWTISGASPSHQAEGSTRRLFFYDHNKVSLHGVKEGEQKAREITYSAIAP